MKLFNNFVIVASDAVVDRNDNTLSIFRVSDRFTFSLNQEEYKKYQEAPESIVAQMNAQWLLISSWSLDKVLDNDLPIVIRTSIYDPSGRELAVSDTASVIKAGSANYRVSAKVNQTFVARPGRLYKYVLTLLKKGDMTKLASGETYYEVEVSEERPQASGKDDGQERE